MFETLGDRRLGDHVLRGLELLLPILLTGATASLPSAVMSALEAVEGTGLVEMGMGRDKASLYGEGDK